MRIAAAAPAATVCSVELSAANAENARAIWSHAGVADRVHCVVGTIGDGGHTLDMLTTEHGFGPGAVDFVFLDHDKDAYVSDLASIVHRGWLHRGSVVVADNVKIPGAPEYRAFMREHNGAAWRTIEHKTHGEYWVGLPGPGAGIGVLRRSITGSRRVWPLILARHAGTLKPFPMWPTKAAGDLAALIAQSTGW